MRMDHIPQQNPPQNPLSRFLEMAAFGFTVVFVFVGIVAQIIANYRRGSTEGLSPFFFILSFFVWFLWSWFGFVEKKWLMFLAQGLGGLLTLIILLQIFVGWPLS